MAERLEPLFSASTSSRTTQLLRHQLLVTMGTGRSGLRQRALVGCSPGHGGPTGGPRWGWTLGPGSRQPQSLTSPKQGRQWPASPVRAHRPEALLDRAGQ